MAASKEQQFLDFFESRVDGVFHYCYGQILDRQQAVVCVQEVFSKVWEQVARDQAFEVTTEAVYQIAAVVINQSNQQHPTMRRAIS